MVDFMTSGLSLVKLCVTFVTENTLLATSAVIGIAGYGISVVKNAIR